METGDFRQLTIDGEVCRVAAGTPLKDACLLAGKEIPTLCWHERLTPASTCRACVVELEGSRTLVSACSRLVEEGMVVHTDSPRVLHARRGIAELLLSVVEDAQVPELQELVQSTGADVAHFRFGATLAQPTRDDNDLYIRDYSQCILCYRCVEACGEDAQNTFAIHVAGRGFGAHIDTGFDRSLVDSDCVFCGNCVQVCPTGALMDKTEWTLRQTGEWDESCIQVSETTCSYCGVGCALDLHVLNQRIVKVTSPYSHPVTQGMLCVKGRYGYEYVQRPDTSSVHSSAP
ncbi:4Fe-4S dicluster domain-containing protein [Alicyclobacillaceae bacterium I2511]|nr:4Fe-4S dicluster domain-containing protein [Alicyclobacillaceae bacterium I2511]